jgi:hypothetical protein
MVEMSHQNMVDLKKYVENLEMIKFNIQVAGTVFSQNEKKVFEDKITTAITLLNYIIKEYKYMPHETYMIIMQLVGNFTTEVTSEIKFQKTMRD